MKKVPDWRELLESYPLADEADWLLHVSGFVTAFVTPPKRERWQWLLTDRPRRVGRDSHKLHSDLDRRTCRPVRDLPAEVQGQGLFYRFADAMLLVNAVGDALYSLVPGELAVHLFHEGEIWLCEAKVSR